MADARSSSDESHEPKKRFRIQRRRLGKIRYIRPDGQFGFIEGEDFREDVFFHRDVWDGSNPSGNPYRTAQPEEGQWVEFELDDEHLSEHKQLRAKVVRPTSRPTGRKLSGRDATFQIITHHPKARRKRPTWRQ